MNYKNHITIDAGTRGGKPCIRGMRISVYDVLSWLVDGMTEADNIEDYPELNHDDITACLSYCSQ